MTSGPSLAELVEAKTKHLGERPPKPGTKAKTKQEVVQQPKQVVVVEMEHLGVQPHKPVVEAKMKQDDFFDSKDSFYKPIPVVKTKTRRNVGQLPKPAVVETKQDVIKPPKPVVSNGRSLRLTSMLGKKNMEAARNDNYHA